MKTQGVKVILAQPSSVQISLSFLEFDSLKILGWDFGLGLLLGLVNSWTCSFRMHVCINLI